MKQPRTQIARTIADKTLKGLPTLELSQEIAAYLLSERRVSELSSLIRDIQEMRAEAGYVEVQASSAHPLTPEIKAVIVERIKVLYPRAKQIIISEDYDPALLGGVRLSLANQQLDLSVQAKLNKFKQLTIAAKE